MADNQVYTYTYIHPLANKCYMLHIKNPYNLGTKFNNSVLVKDHFNVFKFCKRKSIAHLNASNQMYIVM